MKKILLSVSLVFFISGFINAQDSIDVDYEMSYDGKVFIYYNLKADPDEEYDIRVTLRKKSDSKFKLVPSVLVGDAGKGKFAGIKRTIIWHINSVELKQLDGEDFFFEVIALPAESGGIAWYYYIGTLAAGGVAAVLLLNKKESAEPQSTVELTPPKRP